MSDYFLLDQSMQLEADQADRQYHQPERAARADFRDRYCYRCRTPHAYGTPCGSAR